MNRKLAVLRKRNGSDYVYGRLNGPFEYVNWYVDEPTPMAAWKAFAWANALGCETRIVGEA